MGKTGHRERCTREELEAAGVPVIEPEAPWEDCEVGPRSQYDVRLGFPTPLGWFFLEGAVSLPGFVTYLDGNKRPMIRPRCGKILLDGPADHARYVRIMRQPKEK